MLKVVLNTITLTLKMSNMGSLELYDRNTCYMTDDGRQVMA